MAFLWRRNRGGRRGGKREAVKGVDLNMEDLTIPAHFQCPISLDLMKDPVSLSTGITYDRASIEKWIVAGNVTCPVTNQVLRNFDQIPNHALRKMIQEWCVENQSYGVERIPTPRIPITSYEVSDICLQLLAAARSADFKMCHMLLSKVKNLAKESERNRRCILGNGIGSTLAEMFESFAHAWIQEHVNLLKEILSMLTWGFPLGQEGVSKLKSPVSLHCMALFLKGESNDLFALQNTVFVLKDLISEDQSVMQGLFTIHGIEDSLFNIMKDFPISPKLTQACLIIIHHMMSPQEQCSAVIMSRFIQLGLVPVIFDILVDSSKSICEKAIGVLDSICDSEEGKKAITMNALTVPLLVKKILRISNTVTEFSIAILWKLSSGDIEETLIEAVQHGAFQKLLVVIQVGCEKRTKEKATELLRLMNKYRNKLDCFDSSMGFKYVKSSN